jgi:hypothetical protein
MTLVSRINVLSDKLEESRYNLRQQLSSKGVSVSSTEKLDDLIAKVADIEMGSSDFPYFLIFSSVKPVSTRGTTNYNLGSVTANSWFVGGASICGNNLTVSSVSGMGASIPTSSVVNVSSDDIVSYIYSGKEYGINCYYEELLACAMYSSTSITATPTAVTHGFYCSTQYLIFGGSPDTIFRIALNNSLVPIANAASYFGNGAPNGGSMYSSWTSQYSPYYIPEEVQKLKSGSTYLQKCNCCWRPRLEGYCTTTSYKYLNIWQTTYTKTHKFIVWVERK